MTFAIPDVWENLTNLRQLYFNGNQLSAAVPVSIDNLINLQELILNENQLIDLPDLSALVNLQWLEVQQNALTFEDIEPNIGVPSSTFTYSPQDSVGVQVDTTVETESDLSLLVEVGGASNVYQWFKDIELIDGANQNTLVISPVTYSDAGTYTCQITNTAALDLTLYHRPFYVNVIQPMREIDSLALVDIYNSTNGDEWSSNTNWLSFESIDTWYGVSVENNRVVALELANNNLDGPIPVTLGNLDSLNFLNLRENKISGTIPAEIGNLVKLGDLDFAFNELSGEIPAEIGNLSKLGALFLDFNELEGNIPNSLGNLKNLSALYLGDNHLTGTIPDTLCTLSELIVFHLHDNNLTGAVSASFVNLNLLETVNLRNNQLSTFPDISDNIPPLQHLRLSGNNFTFVDIEPYIGTGLTTLTYFSQDSVGSTIDTTITEGDYLAISTEVSGSANLYQWKKDGVNISGVENSIYIISPAQLNQSGSYSCEIISSIVIGLTLYSRPVNVTVKSATDIADNLSGIPNEFVLFQNYPNPFNPVTSIKFALPEPANVKIEIFNILGRHMTTLLDANKSVGFHKVEFNASGFSSGLYLYTISADNFHQIKKMLYVK